MKQITIPLPILVSIPILAFILVTATLVMGELSDKDSRQLSAQEVLQKYLDQVADSELVVLGKVSNIKEKRGVLGYAGSKPYYMTYQEITLITERVLRGKPRTDEILIQATPEINETVKFRLGERVVVGLTWYDTPEYGRYYAVTDDQPSRKFTITESQTKISTDSVRTGSPSTTMLLTADGSLGLPPISLAIFEDAIHSQRR
jgi:hypothetical protein